MSATGTTAEFDPAIRVTDVVRTFHAGTDVPVLRGVDLTVERSTFNVLVGPSGSGKTTLLNLIAGLDAPSSGAVRVFGQSLAELDDGELTRWRRQSVAFVFQAKGLVSHLTAVENLDLALRLAGMPRVERTVTAAEMLDRVGLDSFGGHRPGELSGGQQQRVALARALAVGAPLLVADEPTGELDSDTAAAMIDLLLDRVATSGTTAIVATHDASLAARADRVLRLVDGRVHDVTHDAAVAPSGADRIAEEESGS